MLQPIHKENNESVEIEKSQQQKKQFQHVKSKFSCELIEEDQIEDDQSVKQDHDKKSLNQSVSEYSVNKQKMHDKNIIAFKSLKLPKFGKCSQDLND